MVMRFVLLFLLLFPPVYAASVTAFVSPDSSFAILKDFLTGTNAVKIATYTFTSSGIAELLPANATILVDDSPVGGLTDESMAIFCVLTKKGVGVYLYSGNLRFMHAKYAIKDNAALVTSENFGDDGFPKNPNHGNRGWGVVVEDDNMTKQLEAVFLSDITDSKRFICDGNYSIEKNTQTGTYNPIFQSQRFENQSISLIIAPNAIQPLIDLIDSAHSRILVEQFYIYRYFDRKTKSANPLLEALINASRKGVNVSILLDSFYYNVESGDPASNLYTAEYISNVSKALPIESRLIDLSNGILKLHNKGMIADNSVLISSINWNENSPMRNRETGVIIKGDAADYFASVFNYDFYPENRMTGFATARNYIGIGLVLLIIILFFWMRKRSKISTS